MKYIFVTGGVISGLGKGTTAASLGRLLVSRGYRVSAIKIDPYLNTDAGTMNPFEHGEVFVLDDGGEVDLDLGTYERFLDTNLSSDHNITTGKVYFRVISKERKGAYLGRTVQIIPHVTNEIKNEIARVAENSGADIVVVELGGTVGDIESMPFLEAVRQMRMDLDRGGTRNCLFVHTTLVPEVGSVGEQKTKPTQHSVKELRAIGIDPDIIVARAEREIEKDIKEKISLFCDVPVEGVISAPNLPSIYGIPMLLEEQHLAEYVLRKFSLPEGRPDMSAWKDFYSRLTNPKYSVQVAVVGKYTDLSDAYISHIEAFHHVAAETSCRVDAKFIEAEDIERRGADAVLSKVDAVLVPGGFGHRGVEGKISAAGFARQTNKPYLGVCLGFQCALIEFARNVLDLKDANSTEFNPDTPYPVIDLLPEQKNVSDKGGTMRLGSHKIIVEEGSRAMQLYGSGSIFERHRHRYEVNPEMIADFMSKGIKFSGKSEDGRRMEIAEIGAADYFMGSQFHPEFKSRPNKPSPLHLGLIRAAIRQKYGVSG
ncbi:MAG: CTP synthase (glutamine hydrolyzing) [Candidatus Thermoplasmatota archaeon]|nr:CTP synthase (glutamine hydrolyzing) [Candidatus Thermoplasmatota archaeon]MCL5253141.1 CTP synthase (glutamine hydrolyzing) [Candidatus Thermoplasmatota archaeon]